ncbi:hypothetical protein L202_05830 [Cryptococcus amylolentus CBS 6039]|uniref:Uncharacterized protein n=1 Tax=Cryptococcus amylolentus CBS 6039 TaxID=1295533 RepID=A0A1E3HI73_9TREE|nr:hypothetical protein L202_05830 [Cryptococcus amylolentus CBS 6039]ODN75835.1 hypothetical protein L202_05830 [Cryptococcus amylolentus CBS 6039]
MSTPLTPIPFSTPKRASKDDDEEPKKVSPVQRKTPDGRVLYKGWSDDSLDTLIVSSDNKRFYIEGCMLEGHSTVFRDMFSVRAATSPPQTPLSPCSSGSPYPRLLELTDTTSEDSQTICTLLFILEDAQYTLSRLVTFAGVRTVPILYHVPLFAKKWEMRFLISHLHEWICKVALESYKAPYNKFSQHDFLKLAMLADLPYAAHAVISSWTLPVVLQEYGYWAVRSEDALDIMKWSKKAWAEWTPEWLYALQHSSVDSPGDKQKSAASSIKHLTS